MASKMFDDLDILDLESLLDESDTEMDETADKSHVGTPEPETNDTEEDDAAAGTEDRPDDTAANADTQTDEAAGEAQNASDTPADETDAESDDCTDDTDVSEQDSAEDADVTSEDSAYESDDAKTLEDELFEGIELLNLDSPEKKSVSHPKSPAKRRTPAVRKKTDVRDEDEAEEDAAEEDERPSFPIHLALLAAIAAVVVIAVIRLLIWNNGVELKVHSGQNSGKYIIEVNDNMVYLSDSKLEGHEDDGVTTVLCLGNEPFSQDTSENGLAGQIASLGNVNVINAAFPGSQVTCENAEYSVESLDTMDDIFNLFYVSYAVSIGDFSSLETVASAHTEDDTYQKAVDALKSTDFDKVDIVAIMYDGADYINGMAMQNPDVPDELTTYVGSLTNSFELLQNAYPYIRIVFMSPYYSEYDGASGRTTDIGNGTLVNYFQWAYDTCGSCSVSFLDNYYGSVNENNYTEYLSDGVHLNTAGAEKIADHFVYKVIQDNYAEYDVSSLAVAEN